MAPKTSNSAWPVWCVLSVLTTVVVIICQVPVNRPTASFVNSKVANSSPTEFDTDGNASEKALLDAVLRGNFSDLQIAAIRGDVPTVRKILSPLEKPELTSTLAVGTNIFSSESPLTLAVRNRRPGVVKELIEFGVNVNEWGRYSLTPLANAAESGSVEIVSMLLQAGSDVNAAPDGYTAVMRACIGGHPDTAALLIKAGADVNLARHDGRTALHFASMYGHVECVKLLLKHEADLTAIAYVDETAMGLAQFYKHEEVVRILKAHQANSP